MLACRSFGVGLGRWELGKWSCGIVVLESWEGALWMQDETGGMEVGDWMIFMIACALYFSSVRMCVGANQMVSELFYIDGWSF